MANKIIKKTIEVSKKDLNDIINGFDAAYTYFNDGAKQVSDKSLKRHYRLIAKKYERRVNKYLKIRRELFGIDTN